VEDLRGPVRFLGEPFTSYHKLPTIVPSCPSAHVTEVVGVPIHKLECPIPTSIHGWHGEHERLRPQIQPSKGVGRVGVGGRDGCIRMSEDAGLVLQRVHGRLVLRTAFVQCVHIHCVVVLSHGVSVDVCIPPDRHVVVPTANA